MIELADVGMLMTVVGFLVLGTNVITEVIKQSFKNFPAQVLALVVAMGLTLIAFFGYTAYEHIPVTWYMVCGAVVAGFFVSYGAQFGFDKLKEIIAKYKTGGM